MPPIPVHIDDPITPQKAQGITPQTTEPPASIPGQVPTSTTDQNNSTYPAARPGAAAVPAPTPYAPAPVPAPTRTTAFTYDGPPPPQPGAVPLVPSAHAAPTATSTLPPPPKAGEAAALREAAGVPPTTTTMPPQMNIPPPTQNYAPTHSTTTASSGPTTLNFGAVTPAHGPADRPAGYHQDLYAQEMSPAQRASLDAQDRREHGYGDGLAGGGVPNVGALGGVGENANETVNNVWNAVKGWANTAGQKLAETEEEVWKRINSRS